MQKSTFPDLYPAHNYVAPQPSKLALSSYFGLRQAALHIKKRAFFLSICLMLTFASNGFAQPPADKYQMSQEGEYLFYSLLLTEALSSSDDPAIAQALQGLLKIEPSLTIYQDGTAVLLSRKNYTTAKKIAEEGVTRFPDDPTLTVLLSGSYSEQNENEKAISLLQTFLQKYPLSPEATQELIRLYMNTGERDKAQQLLEKMRSDDRTPALVFFQSKLQSAAGKYSAATHNLQKLVNEYPDFVEAWLELGTIAEKEKKSDEAIGFYRRGLSYVPENNEVRFRIFHLLVQSKKMQEALQTASTAPDAAQFCLQAALYLADSGYTQEAFRLIDEAKSAGAGADDVAVNISLIHSVTSKDPLKALQPLEAISEASPLYPNVARRKIELLIEAKQPEKAYTLAKKLRKNKPDQADLWGLEGYTLLQLQRGDDAIKLLKTAILQMPQNDDLHFALASIQDEFGKKADALATMEHILTINPKNYKALNYIGYTLAEENKDLDRALTLTKAALEIAPNADYIVDSLAWVYYRLGQFDNAWKEIVRCIAMTPPNESTIWEHYGDIALALGKTPEAIKGYSEALKFTPANEAAIRTKLDALQKQK